MPALTLEAVKLTPVITESVFEELVLLEIVKIALEFKFRFNAATVLNPNFALGFFIQTVKMQYQFLDIVCKK